MNYHLDRGGRVAVDGVLEALPGAAKVVLRHLAHAAAAAVAAIHHPDATGGALLLLLPLLVSPPPLCCSG